MTDLEMTRSLGALSLNVIKERVLKPWRAFGRRRKFNTLLDLDQHMLDDIGVTRAEVEDASRLPLSTDAANELRRISLARRRRKM